MCGVELKFRNRPWCFENIVFPVSINDPGSMSWPCFLEVMFKFWPQGQSGQKKSSVLNWLCRLYLSCNSLTFLLSNIKMTLMRWFSIKCIDLYIRGQLYLDRQFDVAIIICDDRKSALLHSHLSVGSYVIQVKYWFALTRDLRDGTAFEHQF